MKKIILTLMAVFSVLSMHAAMEVNPPMQPIVRPVQAQPQGWSGYLGSYLPTWQGIKRTIPYWPAAITAIPPAALGAGVALELANVPMSEGVRNSISNLVVTPVEMYSALLERAMGQELWDTDAGTLALYATYFGTPAALALAGYLYNKYYGQKRAVNPEELQQQNVVIP